MADVSPVRIVAGTGDWQPQMECVVYARQRIALKLKTTIHWNECARQSGSMPETAWIKLN